MEHDREYISYLYSFKSLRYCGIFICSDHMSGLLSDVFCSQLNVLSDKISVFIIYNKTERNVEKSFRYFFNKPKANLHLISSNDIEENLICFNSELVIYLHENVITVFNRPVVYMQPICDFNKKKCIWDCW